MSATTVSFNTYDLASSVPGLRITATDPYRMPIPDIENASVANEDNSITSSRYFRNRKIVVSLEIGQNTRELFDDALDTLKGIVQGFEKALVLSYGSGTRQWTGTLSNMSIGDVQGGHGSIDLEFLCANPMAYAANSTSLFSSARTGSNAPETFRTSGSAPWQQPIITVTLTAVTGGSSKSIVIGNAANGQQITITRTWAAADILIINAQDKTVKVNGLEVAFSGSIPEWAPGAGQLDYSDNFTTRTYSITGIYYKRDL